MENFLDKLFGYTVPWAALIAGWRLRLHEDVGAVLDQASAEIESRWATIKTWYRLNAAKPLQIISAVMAILFAITGIAMTWNVPAVHPGWYKFAVLIVMVASVLYGGYAILLQWAKPKYVRGPDGGRVWNDAFGRYDLEEDSWHPEWISIPSLGVAIPVTLIAMSVTFTAWGYMDRSVGYAVFAFIFLLLAYATIVSFESLVRYVAFKTSRIFVKDLPGLADHIFVLFAGYKWSDAEEARDDRAAEIKRIIEERGELKETSALTWSTKVAALCSFAILLLIAWNAIVSRVGLMGWVFILLLVGVPTVKLLAAATGAKAVDKLQSYKQGKQLVYYLLGGLALLALVGWVAPYYYYAGYACKVFTVVTPTGVAMGWKYYLVTMAGVSAFIVAGVGAFKVASDARPPKAIRAGAWTVFVLASMVGAYLAYGLIQPNVYGAANACVAATERKVGSVSDDPPATEEGEGKEESKRELAKALVGELLPKMVVLAGKALDEKALRLLAEAERKAKDTSKPDEPVVSPLASAQPPRPPLPPSRKARTPSRATPSSAPPATTPGSSEEQRTKAAEAIAFLRSRSAKK